jgi:hypothetical protein
MKNKDNPNYEAQSRIGRNNKNRGRAFEKKCATALGWTRVPYSGGSGEWGKGDVVDGFHTKKGIWVAECKTQDGTTSGNLSVKDKWLKQMQKEADETTRVPVLFLRLNGDTNSFVLLPEQSHAYLYEQVQQKEARVGNANTDYAGMVFPEYDFDVFTRGNGDGFVLDGDIRRYAERGTVIVVAFNKKTDEHKKYYVMHFDDFKTVVRDLSIMAFE